MAGLRICGELEKQRTLEQVGGVLEVRGLPRKLELISYDGFDLIEISTKRL